MIEVKRPGKLFLAGEYAVTQDGYPAIVVPIDRFINIILKKSSDQGYIKSFGDTKVTLVNNGTWSIKENDNRFSYILSALNIWDKYLEVKKNETYQIEITSDLESKDGVKYGLGSSASVVVALFDALAKINGLELCKEHLFKLSTLASMSHSKYGSFADVACISYEEPIFYRKFNSKYIKRKLESTSIKDLVEMRWPNLEIHPFEFPKDWDLHVGWTGKPASSLHLLDKIYEDDSFKNLFIEFIQASFHDIEPILQGFRSEDFLQVQKHINSNGDLIRALGVLTKIDIETNALSKLIEIARGIDMASKLSGAGGGDCGIAIADIDNKDILKRKWKEQGIEYLDIDVYRGKDVQ